MCYYPHISNFSHIRHNLCRLMTLSLSIQEFLLINPKSFIGRNKEGQHRFFVSLVYSCRYFRKGEIYMSEQRRLKDFEELRYRDDFMFGKVMEDRELCREVLECLLQRPVGELTELQTQKEFKYTSDGKPMRLDVYNEDSDRAVYDAEMENLNHKTVESHQLPKRSRFYQAAIDIDYMNKGNSYKKLPESTVMFICTFDPFHLGLSQYTFREACAEKQGLGLDDGTVKIFYNCCYKGNDIPEDLRCFYDYVETGCAENDLTRKIDAAVVNGRRNEIWRSQYMKEWVIIQDAIEDERERAEKAEERARKAEEQIVKAEERAEKAEEQIVKAEKRADQERERAERAEAKIKELEARIAAG